MNEPKKESKPAFGKLEMTIIVCLVSLIACIAIPNFIKSRATYSGNACINNLRQIHAAVNQFALEKGKTQGEAIHFPDDLTPYIKLNSDGKIPSCPQGGTYYVWWVGQTPKCTLGNTIKPSHVVP